ncbi:glycosyltransferase [Halanaerobium sp. Z-7514]|uniref:Glycosyltransferase n=1 Tax=Halanaerobium polyolivorans TaxID=2886943 RepID=A0AAW4X1H2_9FIRM|nr:glycosyltransferase [Halanaerobium polyolivorans]MCC3145668.1 glycosyltransferase [Halanaerobium polyolivorans]
MNKICFFDSRYKSAYGAQKSMMTLIKNLPTEIKTILLTTETGDLTNFSENNNIETQILKASDRINTFGGKILDFNIIKKLQLIIDILMYNFKLLFWLRKNKIDVLYTNCDKSFILSFIAAKIYRIPVVSYKRIISSDDKSRISRFMSYIVARFSNKILCISKGVRKSIDNKLLNKFGYKYEVLYTGYDFEQIISDNSINYLYNNYDLNEDNLIIGLIGSITPRKGHHIAIEAFNKINAEFKNSKLLFVGSVPDGYKSYYNKLKNRAIELSIENKIIWTGYVNNIADHYKLFDCTILPSSAEGLPRVVVESLANDVPVVANDVGGVPEIITNGKFGYIMENNNKKELFKGIKFLIDNESDIDAKNERSEYVVNKFSIENYVNGFIEIINEL